MTEFYFVTFHAREGSIVCYCDESYHREGARRSRPRRIALRTKKSSVRDVYVVLKSDVDAEKEKAASGDLATN